MKKRNLRSLHLNKKTISNLKHQKLKGGYASDRLNSGCTCGGGGTTPPPTNGCELPTDECNFCLFWSMLSYPQDEVSVKGYTCI